MFLQMKEIIDDFNAKYKNYQINIFYDFCEEYKDYNL